MTRPTQRHRERGASAVEYGLLVAGVTAAFLVGAIGLQAVVGGVLGHAVSSVQKDGNTPSVATTSASHP
jgi:Flp pilus assembly pilin Flp